jgi:hypothetical protein
VRVQVLAELLGSMDLDVVMAAAVAVHSLAQARTRCGFCVRCL